MSSIVQSLSHPTLYRHPRCYESANLMSAGNCRQKATSPQQERSVVQVQVGESCCDEQNTASSPTNYYLQSMTVTTRRLMLQRQCPSHWSDRQWQRFDILETFVVEFFVVVVRSDHESTCWTL